MHITNQKLSFNIFTVGNLQNIFMEHDLYLISTNILAIATNIISYLFKITSSDVVVMVLYLCRRGSDLFGQFNFRGLSPSKTSLINIFFLQNISLITSCMSWIFCRLFRIRTTHAWFVNESLFGNVSSLNRQTCFSQCDSVIWTSHSRMYVCQIINVLGDFEKMVVAPKFNVTLHSRKCKNVAHLKVAITFFFFF